MVAIKTDYKNISPSLKIREYVYQIMVEMANCYKSQYKHVPFCTTSSYYTEMMRTKSSHKQQVVGSPETIH